MARFSSMLAQEMESTMLCGPGVVLTINVYGTGYRFDE